MIHAADPKKEASLNPADEGYVNARLCAGCHTAIYKSYMRTGMGRSFGHPRPENTVEDYSVKNSFYHEPSRTWFQMIRRDDRYYQRWYQLALDGKEINTKELSVDYVMGSAIHARAYLHRTADGELAQLPVAWYSEKGGYWGMAPGYDLPSHPYAQRIISYDCIFCHNSYENIPVPHSRLGAPAVFTGQLPEGIDCQRCHGPGKRHIQLAGTPGTKVEEIGAAIVNPKRLEPEREAEVCMQCHLQTTEFRLPHVVKRYERPDFSYRPGEPLGNFEIAFEYAPGTERDAWFQNVSTVDRMRKSQCFIRSNGALKCTTCHDPHAIEHGGQKDHYNAVCRECHAGAFVKLVASGKHTNETGCIDCHMPLRRPVEVVHIVKRDHFIQRFLPAGNPTADIQERHETDSNSYRGEVIPYYPDPLPRTSENEMYVAIAQIRDKANLASGIPKLKRLLDSERVSRPEPWFELGEAYQDQGKFPEAITAYKQSLAQDPAFAPSLLALGVTLKETHAGTVALAALRRATEAAPDNASAWNELGQTEIDARHPDEAKRALEKAIAIDPDVPQPHNGLGILLAQSGDAAGAEKEFRAALDDAPNYGDAHGNLANLLLAQGDIRGAAWEYDIAVRLQPNDYLVRFNYGTMLNAMQRYMDAQRQFEEAIRVKPDFAEAHDLLGNLLERGGDLDGAMQQYQTAVRLSPNLAHAQLDLGATLMKRGDRAGATEHLKAAEANGDQVLRGIAEQLLKESGAP